MHHYSVDTYCPVWRCGYRSHCSKNPPYSTFFLLPTPPDPRPPLDSVVSLSFAFARMFYSWNRMYVVFADRPLWLSNMHLKLVQAFSRLHSYVFFFLALMNIPLYGYALHCLFIYWRTSFCFQLGAIANKSATNMGVQGFVQTISLQVSWVNTKERDRCFRWQGDVLLCE